MTDLRAPLPIGTPVLAYPGIRPDDPFARAIRPKVLDTVTRSEVWEVGGTLVVSVEGYAGGIALSHIDRKSDADE